MQEKMRQLEQQLEASQNASSSPPNRTAEKPAQIEPKTPKVTQAKPASVARKIKTQAGKHVVRGGKY